MESTIRTVITDHAARIILLIKIELLHTKTQYGAAPKTQYHKKHHHFKSHHRLLLIPLVFAGSQAAYSNSKLSPPWWPISANQKRMILAFMLYETMKN